MKNIKIVSVISLLIVIHLFSDICFASTLYTANDGYQYHFSGKGSHSITIYFGGDGNNPQITDNGNGNITVTDAGVNSAAEANQYIANTYGCDNYTRSHISETIIKYTCNGHGGSISNIIEYNGKKYHFNKEVLALDNETANNKTKAEKWAWNHGCDNYIVYEGNLNDHTGRKVYTVECLGHDELADYSTNFGEGFDVSLIPSGDDVDQIKTPIGKVANTIILILQVLTVGGIIVTGIRYMFAGADAKTEIKKTLPYLIIGIVIVFAGPAVIKFIIEVFNDIT